VSDGRVSGVIDRLKCLLFGHDWDHRANVIPEDRETFRCSRCDEWGFNPSMVTETHVSERYIKTGNEQSEGGDP